MELHDMDRNVYSYAGYYIYSVWQADFCTVIKYITYLDLTVFFERNHIFLL